MIIKVSEMPEHPRADGVTTISAVAGSTDVLTAVKLLMSEAPVPTRFILVLSLPHMYVTLSNIPVVPKVMFPVTEPLHIVTSVTGAITGVGFTRIVNADVVPWQPLAIGVTEIVAVTGLWPVLAALNGAISPVPDVASPIDPSLLFQLNVVLLTGPDRFITEVLSALQIAMSETELTVAVGFMVTIKFLVLPVQPLATGVTVTMPVATVSLLFVPSKVDMKFVPEDARPIVVLLLLQLYVVPETVPLKLNPDTG